MQWRKPWISWLFGMFRDMCGSYLTQDGMSISIALREERNEENDRDEGVRPQRDAVHEVHSR